MEGDRDIGGTGGEPTIVFGLGATKAGTSWLYRFLAQHPDCHLRSIKELHFFDALAADGQRYHLRQLRTRRERLKAALENAEGEGKDRLRLAEQLRDVVDLIGVQKSRDPAAYLTYLGAGRGGRTVVADITPAYALLEPEELARMAGLGPRVRFVYLMRDPVARLWSHVRMIAARTAATGPRLAEVAADVFGQVLRGEAEHITSRGDYRRALGRFDVALKARDLFVAFYEELFSAETVGRLCAFLGIRTADGQFGRRVHEGVRIEMTAEQRRQAAAYLRPQYDFVAARMGRLPAAWAANLAGVTG